MDNTLDIYTQSSLAFAAYANITGSLKQDLIGGGMSDSQANDFIKKWTVADQYTDASGVSATVFQEIATGKRYLAIRGTAVV